MSYTLDNIRKEYDRLDSLCGVDTKGIKLSVSHRCCKQYGSCRYGLDGLPSEIVITDFILDEEDIFWDVIRHEYAHALVRLRYPKERHRHDKVFHAACREVGCPPTRYSKEAVRAQNKVKYIVTCDSCGAVWKYFKRSSTIVSLQSQPDSKICPHCRNRSFSVEKVK